MFLNDKDKLVKFAKLIFVKILFSKKYSFVAFLKTFY